MDALKTIQFGFEMLASFAGHLRVISGPRKLRKIKWLINLCYDPRDVARCAASFLKSSFEFATPLEHLWIFRFIGHRRR